MRRVPELDSLRGLAALVVLTFHLDPFRFFPGWSGVDLFFVLSGYLITSILLRDQDHPGFLIHFYARRSIRIWPIYYLMLLGLIAINPFLARPASLGGMPSALTFTQNITLYWGKQQVAPHPATDHLWTLAIEEQFYLIWPALVIWAGRRRLVLLCLIVIGVALACREGGNWFLPKYNERLLLARCDGFALGGLLAGLLEEGGWARRNSRSGWIFAGASGLAMLYLLWGCWSESPIGFIGLPTPSHPAETIFAFGVLYAGIIGLAAVRTGAWWLRPLRFPGLVYLGQISYGLYLYHYVVYWMIDGCDPKIAVREAQVWPTPAIKIGASIAVAVASWHLIERPILRWKDRFR